LLPLAIGMFTMAEGVRRGAPREERSDGAGDEIHPPGYSMSEANSIYALRFALALVSFRALCVLNETKVVPLFDREPSI